MKAIVQDVYGSAEVLQLRDIPKPAPGDGEVLIRVRAAGVDQGVWHLMTGMPYLVRLVRLRAEEAQGAGPRQGGCRRRGGRRGGRDPVPARR